MDAHHPIVANVRGGRWTFTLFLALFALVATAFPGTFLYDRAAIRDGEIWRLLTGHAAHFGLSHVFWNLLLVVPAGLYLEQTRRAAFLWGTAATAVALSLALFVVEPELTHFGGLSGIASALVLWVGLSLLEQKPWRAPGGLLVVATLGKIAFIDMPRLLPPPPDPTAEPVPVALVHVLGALAGGMLYVLTKGAGNSASQRRTCGEGTRG